MTREELLQLIDKAADEGQTELDLAGLGKFDMIVSAIALLDIPYK